jgi:hypothetical protein
VAEHVRKLARRSGDRVLMIVAHGSPENLVPELSGQLQWHLEQSVSGQAALAGQIIGLPEVQLPMGEDSLDDAIERLHDACEPHLMETLRAAVDTELGELIRRHAPRGLARGERAVLWLDWGHIAIPADEGSARDSAERRPPPPCMRCRAGAPRPSTRPARGNCAWSASSAWSCPRRTTRA